MRGSASEVEARLGVAVAAAEAAGRWLSGRFGAVHAIDWKGRVDLVTEADRGAERLLLERLGEALPDDRVVGEEGGRQEGSGASPWSWYVDPLDGTTNFVHGLPFFAVSVGATWRGQPAVGVVCAPALGRTWRGGLGLGAWCGDRRLAVSSVATLDRALLATGFPYDRQDHAEALLRPVARAMQRGLGLRRMGAAALDLAYVAEGAFAGFWEPRLKPWDIAAGALLVREAGGVATDFDGGPRFLETGCVVAAGPSLHPALLALVRGGDAGAADG